MAKSGSSLMAWRSITSDCSCSTRSRPTRMASTTRRRASGDFEVSGTVVESDGDELDCWAPAAPATIKKARPVSKRVALRVAVFDIARAQIMASSPMDAYSELHPGAGHVTEVTGAGEQTSEEKKWRGPKATPFPQKW